MLLNFLNVSIEGTQAQSLSLPVTVNNCYFT